MKHMDNQVFPKDETDDAQFIGRMNAPTAAAIIKGLCGDTMEFYLIIQNDTITEVKYYTDGCGNARRCGQAVA